MLVAKQIQVSILGVIQETSSLFWCSAAGSPPCADKVLLYHSPHGEVEPIFEVPLACLRSAVACHACCNILTLLFHGQYKK